MSNSKVTYHNLLQNSTARFFSSCMLMSLLILLTYPMCAQEEIKPNFIVIMADDCTFRDLEVYGGQAKTPNLKSLASEGMKFNRCFQATAMCAPTRQNLLTGLYPVKNGAYANHSESYEHVKSIVHHLSPAGYQLALTGKRHIGPESVYPFVYSENTSDPDVDFIKKFVSDSKEKKQPFCLFAMCSSPHAPWTYGDTTQYPPENIRLPPYLIDTRDTRKAYTRYFAEITYFDRQVGEILQLVDDQELKSNTVVIVLSEQGSLFPFEKWTCYDAGLRSAMIVRYPGMVEAGTQSDAMVEYVDIVPTILDLANTNAVSALDGKSFKQVLLGNTDQHKAYVYGIQTTRGINAASQAYGIRSVRNDSLKYIVNLFPENRFENALLMNPEEWSPTRVSYLWWMNSWRNEAADDKRAKMILERYQHRPAIELYNIRNDPYELVNLAYDPTYQEAMNALDDKLADWMQAQADEGRATELKVPLR
ncbi:sulfatase [Catalinimonas sp. 4WD22]|uniref:sulfatase family protein n=1 Tax=Catalinimonas locisalis TaxID=3133978 RepID=UPI003101742C